VVAVIHGACLQAGEVGAGAGLGESLRPHLVTGEDPRQVLALLRVGAPVDDRRAHQVQAHRARQHGRARGRVLLLVDDPLDEACPPAAVLRRPVDADPARGVHGLLPRAAALERLTIGGDAVVGGVVQAELGGQVSGQPLAELVAEGVLLGGVLEVHDGQRLRRVRRVDNRPPATYSPPYPMRRTP
jgi:hypothetical protein